MLHLNMRFNLQSIYLCGGLLLCFIFSNKAATNFRRHEPAESQ